ncbi:MAG: hypothetical protein MHM6MM_002544 [Cercozoa sp. M6MM]
MGTRVGGFVREGARFLQVDHSTKLGWIGTGVMGRWMCQHLIESGYSVSVYSRTLSKCAPLEDRGARLCHSPREVAENSDVVFSIVGYPSDVRRVFMEENGVLEGFKNKGGVFVDMTTSEPSLAKEMAAVGLKHNVRVVDAPCSGGDVGARNGQLVMFAGGDKDTVLSLQPLFDCMAKTTNHMGEAGAGQHAKSVNQIAIATGMIGMCEALLYAHKAGLDVEQALRAIEGGAAGSWSLSNYGPRILKGDFNPGTSAWS